MLFKKLIVRIIINFINILYLHYIDDVNKMDGVIKNAYVYKRLPLYKIHNDKVNVEEEFYNIKCLLLNDVKRKFPNLDIDIDSLELNEVAKLYYDSLADNSISCLFRKFILSVMEIPTLPNGSFKGIGKHHVLETTTEVMKESGLDVSTDMLGMYIDSCAATVFFCGLIIVNGLYLYVTSYRYPDIY